MNAPDAKERPMFKCAERVQVFVAGTYTSVRPVVVGTKGLRFFIVARSKVLVGAVLAELEVALLEAGAALVAELPGAAKGLPPPKAKSASSATALPRTLG